MANTKKPVNITYQSISEVPKDLQYVSSFVLGLTYVNKPWNPLRTGINM